MNSRAFASLLSVVGMPAILATITNCQLQGSCDPSNYSYNGDPMATSAAVVHPPLLPPGSGVVDATHWESGPIDGTWLDYPGERSISLYPDLVPSASGAPPALPGNFPGPYTNVFVYVSPNQEANASDSNWTLASGNLAEVYVHAPGPDAGETDWYLTITNATCAQYYMRVVVERALPDAGDLEDGGIDAGAPPDASSDAPPDVSNDATLG